MQITRKKITFAGGSYTKKLNALNCNENHIGLFRLNAKLNLEAGSYTFEISIGQQLADQLNKGFSIMETEKLGPIIIHWDYEKNVPPFYGSFGLDYKVEWE